MAIPSKIPEWNINETNVTEPDATHKADGWLAPGGIPEKPPFQYFNFWQNSVYKWINYFTTEARRLWQNQSIVYNIASDSDYTLTSDQNSYGYIEITDTTPILTGAKNIIVDNIERFFTFKNSTLQILTVKTAAGTGIKIYPGEQLLLRNDTVNIILSPIFTASVKIYRGFKNHIINGEFNVTQRTLPAAVNGSYSADRFMSNAQGGSATASIQVGEEYNWFAHQQTTVGSSAGVILQQRIEDVRTLSGKTATLSFRARASSGAPNISIEIRQYFGSSGSALVDTIPLDDFNLTSSFADYSVTIDIPSVAGKTISGGDDYLSVRFIENTATLYTLNITFIQLEEGTVATPFEQRPIGLEEMLCNRYFQTLKQPRVIGQCVTTARVSQLSLNFNKMRVIPSVDIGAVGNWNVTGAGGTAYPVTAINTIVTRNGSYHFTADIGTSNLVVGNASGVYTNTEEVFLDAEL